MNTILIPGTPKPNDTLFHVHIRSHSQNETLVAKVYAGPSDDIRHPSDVAVEKTLTHLNLPHSAFVAVFSQNPTPNANCLYGTPLGRKSHSLDPDAIEYQIVQLTLDENGCDEGGVYWGARTNGESLFAVQDGMGNIAFVNAENQNLALIKAQA